MALSLSLVLPGCALAYRDAAHGRVHLYGFGHIASRATPPKDGKKAVIQAFTTYGLSTGWWFDSWFLTVGWNREQVVEVVDGDAGAHSAVEDAGDPFTRFCSVAYRDADSDTEHRVGFGHLVMGETIDDGAEKAVVQGLTAYGLSIGRWFRSTFLTAGWSRDQVVEVVDRNTSFQIESPSSDLLNASIGGTPEILGSDREE